MGALTPAAVVPPAAARQVLARHGRSFHWASHLLGPLHAQRAAELYAFCRRIDDVVDGKPPEEAREALARVRLDLRTGGSHDPEIAAFLSLARETGIETPVAEAFLDGFAGDLGPVRIANGDELVRYGYGVAGTVGLMMCRVLDVHEPRAMPFAIDLGVAMQLTNIARDVLEDARRDRLYLPASFLPSHLTPEQLCAGHAPARAAARMAVDRVLTLASRYYRSADQGMRHLPARARLGILTAARVYEAIGAVIDRRRDTYWHERAATTGAGKLLHTARALAAFAHPRSWRRARNVRHERCLHLPLRGLPGADWNA